MTQCLIEYLVVIEADTPETVDSYMAEMENELYSLRFVKTVKGYPYLEEEENVNN